MQFDPIVMYCLHIVRSSLYPIASSPSTTTTATASAVATHPSTHPRTPGDASTYYIG